MVVMDEFEQDMRAIQDIACFEEELRGKKVLVTGANGLVGSYIVFYLLWLNSQKELGMSIMASVRRVEDLQEKLNRLFYTYNIEFVQHDIRAGDVIRDRGIDVIIHAASNAHPLAYSLDPIGTIDTIYVGTKNMLEVCRENLGCRFIYISSSEIYGHHDETNVGERNYGSVNTMDVRSSYSEAKRLAETMCVAYAEQHGMHVSVLRPAYVFGPTVSSNNTRADSQFFAKAVAGEDIILKSSGEQLRSYCYIADLVSAVMYVLLKGESKEAYNLSNSNNNTSIKDFAHTIAAMAGVKLRYDFPSAEERAGFSKVLNSTLDTRKLENLGWKPTYQLTQGIRHTMQIMKALNDVD